MVAVPGEVGSVGAVLLVVGTLVAIACGLLLWRRLGREQDRLLHRVTHGVVALAFACGVAVAPWNAWRVVVDARFSASLGRAEAEGYAPTEVGVDPRLFAAIERTIPPTDTFYVRASPEIDAGSAVPLFEVWQLKELLPRVAVEDPAEADWIVTWGVDPANLGVAVEQVTTLEVGEGLPSAYVARVSS
jgi:hypothetical protein